MLYPAVILSVLFLWIFQTQLYRLKLRRKIPDKFVQKLIELGKKSIETNDVPVGAIVVYNNEVIGEGFNTINKDKSLSGHAEINALNMVFNKFGAEFFELDRTELTLYSSYEPCEMCKGAIVHYNIKNVSFEGKKPILLQIKSTLKEIYYEIHKNNLNAPNMQSNLFLEHPSYRKHHNLD